MKVLNHIKLLLVLAMAILSFSSCEQDDESIYYYIIDRTWVGDLGFAVGPYNVESGITFKGNDYAIDEQYYYADGGGGRAATLPVRWWDRHGNFVSGLWAGLSYVGNKRCICQWPIPERRALCRWCI